MYTVYMNLLDDFNGYVWGLDAKGCILKHTADSLSMRMKAYFKKDTAFEHVKRTVIPLDQEKSTFEFLIREKTFIRDASKSRVRCTEQLSRELALLALKKHPSILYVACDYASYVMTLVADGTPTAITGSKAGEEVDIKLFNAPSRRS